jgi:hypothetical protein
MRHIVAEDFTLNTALQFFYKYFAALKKNQKMEDGARDTVGGSGGKRVRITEETEEVIRRGNRPAVVNRRTNTEIQEEGEVIGGGMYHIHLDCPKVFKVIGTEDTLFIM